MPNYPTVNIKDLQEANEIFTTDYTIVETETGTKKMQLKFLKGKTGDTPNIKIGNVETLESINKAYVNSINNSEEVILNFGIPKGKEGRIGKTPTIKIGNVETLEPNQNASANITGTTEEPILNIQIPKGNIGNAGLTPNIKIGNVNTIESNLNASVNIRGTVEEPIIDFNIPKGNEGKQGVAGTASLSIDDTKINKQQTWSSDKINSITGTFYKNVESNYISENTYNGFAENVEIKGNTVQNPTNLADIKSVGKKLDNQELYEIPLLSTNGLESTDPKYLEEKITILSPVQLEKVGDISDRIIEKNGVWGVEKNYIDISMKDLAYTTASSAPNQVNTIMFQSSPTKNAVMSNGFKKVSSIWDNDTEGFSVDSNSMKFRILRSKLKTHDLKGFLEYVESNMLFLKIVNSESKFIPLPHDQQILLKTFDNKTNILFLTEIEGTIKASLPCSIQSSLNSVIKQTEYNSKKIDDIFKMILAGNYQDLAYELYPEDFKRDIEVI